MKNGWRLIFWSLDFKKLTEGLNNRKDIEKFIINLENKVEKIS